MIGTGAGAALLDRQTREGLVIPDYGGYCFAGVPGAVADVLDVHRDVGPTLPRGVFSGVDTDVSNVVVVLLDGLGWRRWRRDAGDHRFLSRLRDRGRVTPLTTVCPSSTATAITTVHTAATPAEHGVLGWDVRLPAYDTVVGAFPHAVREDVASARAEADESAAEVSSDGGPGAETTSDGGTGAGVSGDGVAGTATSSDGGTARETSGDRTPPLPSSELVAADPIYPALREAGVESRVVQPAGTLGTDYADATFRGATPVPADGPAETAESLRETLESADGPSYTYVYLPQIDATSHAHGTDSGAYLDALATTTRHLSRELYDRLDPDVAAETLLLVTADHGMVDFEPGPAGCLDLRDIDAVEEALARDQAGRPVPPFADPRLTHVDVRDGEREAAVEALESRGVRVFTRETVREMGLYGDDHGPVFERRCGDLVLTHPELKLVHPATAKVRGHVGMHGGPTPGEMLVPFAAAKLSALQ